MIMSIHASVGAGVAIPVAFLSSLFAPIRGKPRIDLVMTFDQQSKFLDTVLLEQNLRLNHDCGSP